MRNRLSLLYWIVLAGVAAVEIAPLFLVKFLPLVDLPNHEARIAILAHYGSNPTMQKYYVVDWRPIPDLAFDLFAVPLVRLGLSPIEAGRLFLATAVLLYVTGGHLLAKAAAGRRSWLGVILPFLFYSSALFYGFINFVFGFGVFLVAFALWLRWRIGITYGRTAVISALLVVAFLSHLAAFGLLAVAIVVTIAFDRRLGRTSSSGRSLLAFLPALALFAYSSEARGSKGTMSWGSLVEKAHVLAGTFLSYNYKLDALWILGVVAIAVVAVVLARSITIEPAFATLAALLALIFVLLPHTLITATNVDARPVPAAVAFFLCAIRLSLPPRIAATLAIGVVALGVGRVAVIKAQWRTISDEIAAQVQALDTALPRNANVYSLFPEGGAQVDKRQRPYAHIVSYATIDRNAHVSRTFAERSQQPLVSRVDEAAAENAAPPFTVNPATFRRYSYVWSYKPGPVVRRQLQGRCVRVYARSGFYLCRRSRQ
jgi:hypothetical protein